VVNDSSKMDIAMATTHNQYFTWFFSNQQLLVQSQFWIINNTRVAS
jgi:hypothetical protein